MDNSTDTPHPSAEGSPPQQARAQSRQGVQRLPSPRAAVLLAAAMLGIGVAVGAAIGPTPDSSIADGTKIPTLIASLAARQQSSAAPAANPAAVPPPAVTPEATPAAAATTPAGTAGRTAEKASSSPAASETEPAPASKKTATATLPPITNVWFIQLSGVSFAEAIAKPTAAPYMTGQLIPKGTLLGNWSALEGSAFASEAALAEHQTAEGATPPLLHSIVQPPCPEGAAGAACATGTPGELTAADEFLKATLATITATPNYREHGLVVVTFATVGNATASELPAGSSSATLTSQPPAGTVLLSPFAKAGLSATTTFNATSPMQSLEKLLHSP
jgi:hypothetical protein